MSEEFTVDDVPAGGWWSHEQWEEWSNSLAEMIPEDDVAKYANPEGAQESIITDCLRAYLAAPTPAPAQPRPTRPVVDDAGGGS